MTRKKFIIYTLLTVLMVMIGLVCGYFLLSDTLSETIAVSISFDLNGFKNLIIIVLIEFVFGLSVITIPVCLISTLYRGLIYGCSFYFILNNINRIEITIFHLIVYLFILTVYVFTSMTAISYSKSLKTALPDIREIIKLESTHKYIKRFLIYSATLLFLHMVKILFLYIFY